VNCQEIERHSLRNARRPKGTAALTLSVDAAAEKTVPASIAKKLILPALTPTIGLSELEALCR
jgi:hypothetical protein